MTSVSPPFRAVSVHESVTPMLLRTPYVCAGTNDAEKLLGKAGDGLKGRVKTKSVPVWRLLAVRPLGTLCRFG